MSKPFRRRRAATLVTALGLLAGVLLVADPSARATGGGVLGTQVPENPLELDVALLAADLNIGVDELKSQLALQDAMDTIDFEILDSGYAEDGSRLGVDFELWYRSAEAPNAGLKAAMAQAGVLDHLRFERVPLS